MTKGDSNGTPVKKSTEVPYRLSKATQELFSKQFGDRHLPPLDQLRKK